MIPVGSGLRRPESVLATARGDLWCSDARGGVTVLHADGTTTLRTGTTADLSEALQPNGIALEPDGAVLIAHLGDEGGVFRLDVDGGLAPVLREVDGVALTSTNFVTRDRAGRLWTTVCTRSVPRTADYRPDAATGYVVLGEGSDARIVADGLGYANECLVTPDGAWLYVNETFARRLSRFPVRGDGLGDPEVVAEITDGFPDGLGLDVDGGVWVVCIVADRVLRVDPAGTVTTVLAAGDPARVAAVDVAFRSGTLSLADLADTGGSALGSSSIAFGGPDRRTAYLGSLHNDHLTSVPVPVAGIEPVHWRYTVEPKR